MSVFVCFHVIRRETCSEPHHVSLHLGETIIWLYLVTSNSLSLLPSAFLFITSTRSFCFKINVRSLRIISGCLFSGTSVTAGTQAPSCGTWRNPRYVFIFLKDTFNLFSRLQSFNSSIHDELRAELKLWWRDGAKVNWEYERGSKQEVGGEYFRAALLKLKLMTVNWAQPLQDT